MVGVATKSDVLGRVTSMVAVPVPVTVVGAESLLCILMVCTIVASAERSTCVSTPCDGSNFASVTFELQSVVLWSIVSQTVCEAVWASARVGRTTATAMRAIPIERSRRRSRFQARGSEAGTPPSNERCCSNATSTNPAPLLPTDDERIPSISSMAGLQGWLTIGRHRLGQD